MPNRRHRTSTFVTHCHYCNTVTVTRECTVIMCRRAASLAEVRERPVRRTPRPLRERVLLDHLVVLARRPPVRHASGGSRSAYDWAVT